MTQSDGGVSGGANGDGGLQLSSSKNRVEPLPSGYRSNEVPSLLQHIQQYEYLPSSQLTDFRRKAKEAKEATIGVSW